MEAGMIQFHLDTRSGLSPYQQLVRQVRQALRLGLLARVTSCPPSRRWWRSWRSTPTPCSRPTRELEHEGLVAARPGVGTFVTATLADDSLAAHGLLRQELRRWLARARRAGLDEKSIEALFMTTFRTAAEEDIA
jgi:GntR family transcriptional regulator